MKKFSIIIIVGICIFVIFSTEISFTQEDTEEQRLKALYPANSFKYRGVVSIDIGDGDTNHELICDFGSNLGLWLYDNTAVIKWTQINPDSPTFMVRSDLKGYGVDTCLICDFGTPGLWHNDGNRSRWIKIYDYSPDPN